MIKIKIWSITGYVWINLFKLWPTEIGVNHHNIYMEKCQKKVELLDTQWEHLLKF